MIDSLDKQSYFLSSRNNAYNLIFIFPMVVLYEGMILVFRNSSDSVPSYFRNGVDVLLRTFFDEFGVYGSLVYILFILIILVYVVAKNFSVITEGKINFNFLVYMLVESVLLASIFSYIVMSLSEMVSLDKSFNSVSSFELFYLSLGAGIWEELLFRFFLVGFIIHILNRLILTSIPISVIIAIIVSSFLFAVFHYLGPYAEEFSNYTFVIRYAGGIFLGMIYYLRGIGIAVYTHIFYDLAICLSL